MTPSATSGDRTRLKLLDAGLAVLRDEPTEKLFERLDARPISQAAGVTTGAFYHHFGDADGFVGSLLAYALEKKENPPFGAAVAAFGEVLAAGGSFADGLIAGGQSTLAHQETNVTFALELSLWAKSHRDPQVAARLDRMYGVVEQEMANYFQVLLGSLGRVMRPPYTVEQLARVFVALQEGLTLRRGVDQEAVPLTLLGELLVPIVLFMTSTEDDDADAAAWLASNGPPWPR